MTDSALFTISDPDNTGKVKIKYKLKPFYEFTLRDHEAATIFVYGFWAGYKAKLESKVTLKTQSENQI